MPRFCIVPPTLFFTVWTRLYFTKTGARHRKAPGIVRPAMVDFSIRAVQFVAEEVGHRNTSAGHDSPEDCELRAAITCLEKFACLAEHGGDAAM